MLTSALTVLLAATGVAAQAACPPLHFVYARATSEPPTGVDSASAAQWETAANKVWSKGYGAAGYSMFTNVTSLIPAATGWPVHYPASFSGCASENAGVADMLDQLQKVSTRCPDTLFALGGHSQGGVVTVRTIPKIPANILSKIVAVTMVGSPSCPAAVAGKCKSFCNSGDTICEGTGSGMTGRCNTAKRSTMAAALANADVYDETWALTARALGRAPTCGAEPAEKGHKAKGSAHMAYNADGFYVEAAACYILAKYKAAGGVV